MNSILRKVKNGEIATVKELVKILIKEENFKWGNKKRRKQFVYYEVSVEGSPNKYALSEIHAKSMIMLGEGIITKHTILNGINRVIKNEILQPTNR